jgi:hypothetical protein
MARRGATTRDPKVHYLPGKPGTQRMPNDTDVKRGGDKSGEQMARIARSLPTERLSPGVYRSAGGELVTQQGRPVQRQPQQGMAQQVAGGMQQSPMVNQIVGQMTPDQLQGASGIGKTPFGWSGGQLQDAMYRSPEFMQMPQASANMGGQYRLSPGVYGTREQAMQQYNQQMQQMAMQGANQAMSDQGNSGPGNFPMQQRAREIGYAENRFNADRNNNLFRGNPIKRFKF